MSLLDIKSLKDNPYLLLVDSYKVVKKFIEYSSLKPAQLFINESLLEECDFAKKFPDVKTLSDNDFKDIPGVKYHKGIIGVFHKNLNFSPELKPPFVILNGVTSPENVGSIVRTLSGLNFKTLVIDEKTVSPYVRRAIRVSMGNIVFLNVLKVSNLKQFIKDCPYPIYATGNEKESFSLEKWNPERESGFIIGSEGHGMDQDLYDLCKNTICIPVRDEVQHYNAGHSCAILASRYLFNTAK